MRRTPPPARSDIQIEVRMSVETWDFLRIRTDDNIVECLSSDFLYGRSHIVVGYR